MINIKKGTGLTLQQSSYVVAPYASNATSIVQGMVVSVIPVGTAGAGLLSPLTAAADKALLPGFAIQNQVDGDVVNSGFMSVYTLDGASIIQTDQSAVTINLTNYPIGTPVYAVATGTGQVTNTSNTSANPQVGNVESITTLPSGAVGSAFAQVTVLGIKLISA